MRCNKWLVTQPPFSLMGQEREVFHICRLPHIFHFSISVDLRAAFIQLAGLALMLSPGAWNQPMLSPTNRTDSWLPLLNTCWLVRPSFTRGQPRFPFLSVPGPGLKGLALRGLPPILKSWGSRAWSCLPLAWSSSFSWQFSSSLASWSPCPHLKVRAHLRPLKRLTDT